MSEFVPLSHVLRPTFLVQVQPMRLIKIYNVAKEETFLAHLLENDLTLTALKTVVQDRGNLPNLSELMVHFSENICLGSTTCIQKS